GTAISAEEYAPSMIGDPAFAAYVSTYFRNAASPGAAAALLRMNTQIDIRPVLSSIAVPTLVLHRRDDRNTNLEEARYIAARIPTAQLVELNGGDHFPWLGDSDAVLAEIERFLTGAASAPEPDRVLATILFTDIVGSTEQAARHGDRRWRELVELHHAAVRRELERYRGHEVDTAGDGFFASFDGPARAIRCACAIRESVRALGLQIRAGLHTGECELIGAKIGGIAVHIG